MLRRACCRAPRTAAARRCGTCRCRRRSRRREHAGDLVAGDRDRLRPRSFSTCWRKSENAHRVLGALESCGELPDQDPDDDEDHPEQQALEGRIQPEPPKRLTFKSITPCEGSVTRKSSRHRLPDDPDDPVAPSTTSGSASRSSRGTFRSTRKSCSLRVPGAPSGLKPVPGPPAPDRQRQVDGSGGDRHFGAPGRPRLRQAGIQGPGQPFRPDRHPLGSELNLSRDRQRKRERVSTFARPASRAPRWTGPPSGGPSLGLPSSVGLRWSSPLLCLPPRRDSAEERLSVMTPPVRTAHCPGRLIAPLAPSCAASDSNRSMWSKAMGFWPASCSSAACATLELTARGASRARDIDNQSRGPARSLSIALARGRSLHSVRVHPGLHQLRRSEPPN